MTLSKKKRARKEAARKARKYEEDRLLSLPQYQNRQWPDGTPMDPTEAIANWPELIPQREPFAGSIEPGCDCLVAYANFEFWLSNVQVSHINNEFCGDLPGDGSVPENDICLDADHGSICFERRHVIRVRSILTSDRHKRALLASEPIPKC